MNILLLSNGAPNYHHFFNNLAQLFCDDGSRVVVAVDSEFSREVNELKLFDFSVYEFSSYFAKHKIDNALLEKYSEFNLNFALLSDFERATVYGLWGRKKFDYFEKLKSALLSYFEDIFRRDNISVVLYENVSNAFAYFAFFVAKKYGARYVGIGGSRLPGRFSITADPLDDSELVEEFRKIRAAVKVVDPEVRTQCKEYLNNIETIVPDYMKTNGSDNTSLVRKYGKAENLKRIARVLRHSQDDSYHSFQIGNPARTYLNLFLRNFHRRLKLFAIGTYYEEPVAGEDFLLYPIHFHPESSTSILAGTYLDEYEVIRNIAFNLPQGLKLYVKDHISAWGYPSLEFYKKIRKLPNVRLLHPGEQTKALIKQSAAVITLTSTVGYEAILMGKKAFVFGKVFYDFHKSVVRINNPSELFGVLRGELGRQVDVDEKYNLDFVCAYYLSTKPVPLNLTLKGEAAKLLAVKVHSLLTSSHDSRNSGDEHLVGDLRVC